ncbi:MAG TPA: hypothetical protein VNO21_08915 [Polyangiaceae bacterium]|nr:hypothetical protein [Polyangiaceae bacterium]
MHSFPAFHALHTFRRWRARAPWNLAVLAILTLVATEARPADDPPLQAWMKANTAPAVASGDLPALAIAFDKLVGFAPKDKEFANWPSIARDGAAAARAGKLDGAKAACRSCHAQYRPKYRLEMRSRPLP